ncbi:ABC transporter ATP-binding protein [Lysobacter sp. A3-1-A15]|uniref:ABC transporter ATP-binding protein n=1 Tax=Novilysobacter viscosus TaxID=3098602 RepID=UPI002ED8C8EB
MIALRQVRKSFGGRPVLDGLDLRVGRGEIYGLLGPNGCGKSTSINLICGRLQAEAGSIEVDGSPATVAGAAWLGVVTQDVALYPDLSCRQNLEFFACLYGLDRTTRRARVEQVLQELELVPYADQPAVELSGGWRRRLHVAIGVVHRPRLLILDEPTASVDLAARHALWQVIRRQRDRGTTVLLTTHHLDEAEQLCDRIGILHRGRLLVEDTPAGIRATVPAEQIAVLDAADLQPLRARADALGLRSREYGGRLGVLLPSAQSLAATVHSFEGLELRSLALNPVNLEHAYLQLLDAAA